jgi:hypothetical protein
LSPRELYRPSDRHLVTTFADRWCRVVSAADSHGGILGFLEWSRYYFLQVAPQLYSRGWIDPVPDPLLLRKSGSAANRTQDLWICSQELLQRRLIRLFSLTKFVSIPTKGWPVIVCRMQRIIMHSTNYTRTRNKRKYKFSSQYRKADWLILFPLQTILVPVHCFQ